jgi:hypothetical protein
LDRAAEGVKRYIPAELVREAAQKALEHFWADAVSREGIQLIEDGGNHVEQRFGVLVLRVKGAVVELKFLAAAGVAGASFVGLQLWQWDQASDAVAVATHALGEPDPQIVVQF